MRANRPILERLERIGRAPPLLIRSAGKALTVILALLAIASAVQGCRHALNPWGSIDLGMPLKAAERLQTANPYQQHLARPEQFGRAPDGDGNPFPMTPMQAPSVLTLLWPLTLLSWPAAKLVWFLSNLAFTAGVLALAFRRLLPGRSRWTYAAIAGLLLIGFPWRVIVSNGQHLLAGLFFYLLAMELADRRRPVWAGIALALSLIKYTSTFWLLPWLALKRQWAPLLVAGAAHGAMTTGIALWLRTDPVTLMTQAIEAASGTLRQAGYLDLFALGASFGAPSLAAGLVAAVVFILVAAFALKKPEPHLYLTGLCLLSTILVYHRSYDLLILLIPGLVMIDRWRREPVLAGLIGATIFLTWYADRAVLALTDWLDRGPDGARGGVYFYIVVLLCYASVALALVRQWKSVSVAPAAAAS